MNEKKRKRKWNKLIELIEMKMNNMKIKRIIKKKLRKRWKK